MIKGATIVLTIMIVQPVLVLHLFMRRSMVKILKKTELKMIRIQHKTEVYCMWRKKTEPTLNTRKIRCSL